MKFREQHQQRRPFTVKLKAQVRTFNKMDAIAGVSCYF